MSRVTGGRARRARRGGGESRAGGDWAPGTGQQEATSTGSPPCRAIEVCVRRAGAASSRPTHTRSAVVLLEPQWCWADATRDASWAAPTARPSACLACGRFSPSPLLRARLLALAACRRVSRSVRSVCPASRSSHSSQLARGRWGSTRRMWSDSRAHHVQLSLAVWPSRTGAASPPGVWSWHLAG